MIKLLPQLFVLIVADCVILERSRFNSTRDRIIFRSEDSRVPRIESALKGRSWRRGLPSQ